MLPIAVCLVAPLVGGAEAPAITFGTDDYGTAGLFTSPLVPGEGDTVSIGLRANITGDAAGTPTAQVTIIDPRGLCETHNVALTLSKTTAVGRLDWTAPANGLYRVEATIRAGDARATTELDLPVVIPGRRPHFVYYSEQVGLRWPTIWAGGAAEANIDRWLERGVTPLAWRWGSNHPGEVTDGVFLEHYTDTTPYPGFAADECGSYLDTEDPDKQGMRRFVTCMRGMEQARRASPDVFGLVWHCGSFYPEHAALYRDACDLVVLESYVFKFVPEALAGDSVYAHLDMKMRAAREADLLVPTGKGPQVITSVELMPDAFNRGEMENVVRHLRRNWPEMRGMGFFGFFESAEATPDERAKMAADARFVDRLCYDYFVAPVVTLLPGSLWATRHDSGEVELQAAVSNIGGMDSGPVEVEFQADGKPIGRTAMASVPAGDSSVTNRRIASAKWRPSEGYHDLAVQIVGAKRCTVLDGRVTSDIYW